jgi:hypothetical protein
MTRRIVEPQSHEYAANYNYNAYGLRPWFALDAAVKEAGGSRERTFSFRGETWTAKLYYQNGNLKPPAGGETPAGTEVAQETIREFRVSVVAHDEVRQRKANFHLRPRWADLKAEPENGGTTDIPVPHSLANSDTDAVSVRINGSNIPFTDYGDLLRCAVEAVDVNPRYLDGRHPTSNVTDAARYVRVNRHQSGPIHARAGPLAQLAHVLEDDRDGYRKLVQNDANERDEKLPGYYHTATLGPQRVREVMPDHTLPVELKHYYAREALERDDSDPLAHPKLETAFQRSRLPHDETLGATDADLDRLVEELDEWLYSVLADAGLDLRAGGGVYESDAYFEAVNATTDADVIALDLTEIRHEQESVVYRHLADGMSESERDTLRCLVTDGGQLSPADVAEQTDRHRDTVYDALQSMHDLVQHEYGEVSLRSTYLSELVTDALEAAEGAVARATKAAAEAVEAERRGLDEHTSAFLAWAEQYGVNYRDGEAVEIEVAEVDAHDGESHHSAVRRLLREGLSLWREMGRDEAAYRSGTVTYPVPLPGQSDATRRCRASVWRMVAE